MVGQSIYTWHVGANNGIGTLDAMRGSGLSAASVVSEPDMLAEQDGTSSGLDGRLLVQL